MPRILSLDKMLQDLRGAAQADSSKQGFIQGFEQGKTQAAASEAAAIAASRDTGMAAGAEAGRAAAGGRDTGFSGTTNEAAAGGPASPPETGGLPVHPDMDQLAEQYFRQLASANPPPQVAGVDTAALDAAHRASGNEPMRPGGGNVPGGPPPGAPPLPPALQGLSSDELAQLEAMARNPPQLAETDYGFGPQ